MKTNKHKGTDSQRYTKKDRDKQEWTTPKLGIILTDTK